MHAHERTTVLRGVQADHAPSLLAAAGAFRTQAACGRPGAVPATAGTRRRARRHRRCGAAGRATGAWRRLRGAAGCRAGLWACSSSRRRHRSRARFHAGAAGSRAGAPPRQLALEDAMQVPAARVLSTQPQGVGDRPAAVRRRMPPADRERAPATAAPRSTLDPTSGQRAEHGAAHQPRRAASTRWSRSIALRVVQLAPGAQPRGLELVRGRARWWCCATAPATGIQARIATIMTPAGRSLERRPGSGQPPCGPSALYLNPRRRRRRDGVPAWPDVTGREPVPGRAIVFDNMICDEASPHGRPDPESLHAGLPVDATARSGWRRCGCAQRRYRAW